MSSDEPGEVGVDARPWQSTTSSRWFQRHVPTSSAGSGRTWRTWPGSRAASGGAHRPGTTCVQDARTRAWRRRETYDAERGPPRTWLLAIVAGEARRGWRRRRRPQPVFEAWVDDGAEDVDRRIDVERAIAVLLPRQRLAVALHYFVDLRVEDCAAVMDCAPGTVKWLLHEARTRLALLVED